MTVTAQQRYALIKSQDPAKEPHKAFTQDLRKHLKQLTDQGDEILLVGDFDQMIDEQFNGICKILADFQLFDLMQGRSSTPFPATYARGKYRFDFGSQEL
jgi:hypothetical protein